ncbi:hypothetical protein CEXT_97871 [Caerostris extrusa]|uniref:Uncharacterized protein n=1 Tax=Caerostris extrusa TaxID=172846 RepID=A0AAV4NUQ1_CAEEX|nr:hypothetical protein CEXT_97871 [Caerostris extrusa]
MIAQGKHLILNKSIAISLWLLKEILINLPAESSKSGNGMTKWHAISAICHESQGKIYCQPGYDSSTLAQVSSLIRPNMRTFLFENFNSLGTGHSRKCSSIEKMAVNEETSGNVEVQDGFQPEVDAGSISSRKHGKSKVKKSRSRKPKSKSPKANKKMGKKILRM